MSQNRTSAVPRVLDSSLIVALFLTAAFYAFIHQDSMQDSKLYHYTAEHAVEYVIVALFIWGLVDAAGKALRFSREFHALGDQWLPPRQGREPVASASALLEQVQTRPKSALESKVGRRITEVLEHAPQQASAEEYREHLHDLSRADEDEVHSSYTLMKFVVGVTPVLGFLGTVVHFGTALSGISFDEMSDRLPIIVAEMGTAFDTTTVALAAAMTMMFTLFFCQRIDERIVHAVDRLVNRELLKRFDFKDPSIAPFLSSVQAANEEALRAMQDTLRRQIDVWSKSLNSLFERFDVRRQGEIQNWHAALETLQRRYEDYDNLREERINKTLTVVDGRQEQHLARIEQFLEGALAVRDDFVELANTLDTLARGEGKLVETQDVLANNLRVIRETQQIDQALHGLTAAIHLLTARHQQGGHAAAA